MNIVWGILMALIGLFLFISALKRSEFIVYRLLHARSRLLWGEHAHTFLQVVGLVLIGLSSLFFFGVW